MAARVSISAGSPEPPGVTLAGDGVNVAVVSRHAGRIDFCLFDARGETEIARLPLPSRSGDVWSGHVSGVAAGARYGLRADGPDEPARGHRFDPTKLLVDPYAVALDRPFAYHPDLAAPRAAAIDTAALVPKAIVTAPIADATRRTPAGPAGLIYEVSVRAFTKLHPDVPHALRGTIAGLAQPAVLDHLVKLGVEAVELMAIAAWIDERHLPPLGLTNAWGYNPVVFMVPDPRLAPGGLAEIRTAVTALHEAGIRVLLDAVYNHTGESDATGPTLSLRGLDNALYYRHDDHGQPLNDAGTGNTLAADRPEVVRLIVDAMRHWVRATGIDGYRLDLAAVLGRTGQGFRKDAPLLAAIEADPLLGQLTMIAEPWDVGPGGYHLGNFPPRWGEWNDRYRDDVRRFWRGDGGALGAFATRIAGSADVFGGRNPSASVNFLAAHDGFALNDVVSFAAKHNAANGEENRDGTDANFSWNNGVEGATTDPAVAEARRRDVRVLLATLFASRGTPMLTAGDEFGRTQNGNNNAYAQDNETTWLDWQAADAGLAAFTGRLAAFRKAHRSLAADAFLTGEPVDAFGIADMTWLAVHGGAMTGADWSDGRAVGAALYAGAETASEADRTAVWVNGDTKAMRGWLPPPRAGYAWWREIDTSAAGDATAAGLTFDLPARAVVLFAERRV